MSYPLLRQLGFPVEYFPSYDILKISKQEWEPLMAERVLEAIRLIDARIVVVVDHHTYKGLPTAKSSPSGGRMHKAAGRMSLKCGTLRIRRPINTQRDGQTNDTVSQ